MDGGFEMDSGSIDETNDLINQVGFSLNSPIQYNGFLPGPLLTGDREEDCQSSIDIVRQFSHNLPHTTFGLPHRSTVMFWASTTKCLHTLQTQVSFSTWI